MKKRSTKHLLPTFMPGALCTGTKPMAWEYVGLLTDVRGKVISRHRNQELFLVIRRSWHVESEALIMIMDSQGRTFELNDMTRLEALAPPRSRNSLR